VDPTQALAPGAMDQLYGQWFDLADADKDGMVSGIEAVAFLSRSGLPKQTLAQVWEMSDTDKNGKLARGQFNHAIQLVAFAQRFPGMPLANASSMQNPLPPPTMQGLAAPMPHNNAMPQQQQSQLRSPDGAAVADGGSAGDLGAVDAEFYRQQQHVFNGMDQDRDGFLQGSQCFTFFMQSGLDKSKLKHIWDVVAGSKGQLSFPEFITCQQLIACAKAGKPLPTKLPPNFTVTIKAQPLAASSAPAVPAAAPQPPPPSQPLAHVSPVTGDFAYVSKTPVVPFADLNVLGAGERTKLTDASQQARQSDEERQRMQFESNQAKQNLELYQTAMQELVLFKSRAEAEMIQLSALMRSASTELENAKKQYEERFMMYEATQRQLDAQRDQLSNAQKERAKLMDEIDKVNSDTLTEGGNLTEPLQEMEAEVASLRAELESVQQVQVEAKLNCKRAVSRVQVEKQNLEREIEACRSDIESAKAESDKHRDDLAVTREKAQGVLSQSTMDRQALSQLLNKSGKIFQALSQAALKAGVEIPQFSPLKLEWSGSLACDATAWEDDMRDGQGFTAVERLGDIEIEAGGNKDAFRPGLPIQVSLEQSNNTTTATATNASRGAPAANASVPAVDATTGGVTQRSVESDFGTKDIFASPNTSHRSMNEDAPSATLDPPKLAPPKLAPPTLAPPKLAPPTLAPPTLAPPKHPVSNSESENVAEGGNGQASNWTAFD